MLKRTKVALLIESSRAYGRGLLRVIAALLHTRPDWPGCSGACCRPAIEIS